MQAKDSTGIHVATGGFGFQGAGLADVASGRAAQLGDKVEISSVSKVFLAVTTLRLVEQGLLGLDDPLTQCFDVNKLVP